MTLFEEMQAVLDGDVPHLVFVLPAGSEREMVGSIVQRDDNWLNLAPSGGGFPFWVNLNNVVRISIEGKR